MAISTNFSLFLTLLALSGSFSLSSSTCRPQIHPFLHDLKLQCPAHVVSASPIEMDGESLERLLGSSKTSVYIAVLFYASWCPFSRNVGPKFAALAAMYPQIKHVMVEQSSAFPSVFSRHGIHSVPSVLMVNRTSRAQHHGPKDLPSLLHFYHRTTGLEPTVYLSDTQITSSDSETKPPPVLRPLNPPSLKDLASREPYLAFSLLFVFLKAFLYLFPNVVSGAVALWAAYVPRLNLAIFGESKQLLARALNLVDVKRAFSRLKLSKSGNFRNGARSARALASSLASVALGETSTAAAAARG